MKLSKKASLLKHHFIAVVNWKGVKVNMSVSDNMKLKKKASLLKHHFITVVK